MGRDLRQNKQTIMKKDRKVKEHLAHFDIAGFTYYDGAEAFPELKVGLKLDLELDPDNRYDPRAVMITYKDFKLGYVPRAENRIFYKLLKVGVPHLEVHIQRLNPTGNPEQQVGVVAHLREVKR